MAIPLARGREFDDGDVYERPFVAIISESLARESFGEDDPIGQRIMCGFDQPDKWMTIVGVVGDVRQDSPASVAVPQLYMPLRQHPYAANEVQIVLRTRVGAAHGARHARGRRGAAGPGRTFLPTRLRASRQIV